MVLALAPLGCGGRFTGKVTGTVKYNGKLFPGGKVTFFHPDGRIGEGDIQEEDTYAIPKAPGGAVKVTVHTLPPIGGLPADIPLPGAGDGCWTFF
jgi:hypothetical protein